MGYSTTTTHTTTESQTILGFHEVKMAYFMLVYGNLDVKFVADVRVEFPDGQTIDYKEEGTIQNAQYGYKYIQVKPYELPPPPPFMARIKGITDDDSDDGFTEKEGLQLQPANHGGQLSSWRKLIFCNFRHD